MMQFQLSDEHEMIQKMVRDFAKNEVEPTAAERDACQTFIRSADSVESGLQNVLWSLINTREFLLQH